MKLHSLLGHTTEIYQIVLNSNLPADYLISKYFKEKKYLGSNDRKFISENLYNLIRNKLNLEYIITNEIKNKFENENDFIVYQLILQLFKNNYAFEYKDVELLISQTDFDKIKSARNYKYQSNEFVKNISINYSFSEWFIKEMEKYYSNSETEVICQSLNQQAPITLRTNTLKITRDELSKSLLDSLIETTNCKYSPDGLNLKKRLNIFTVNNFKNGEFEMQDEGSQILTLLLDPKPGKIVVDACCGSGGKTLAMSMQMKNKGAIFALDINENRLNDIKKRIKRSGADNVRINLIEENKLPEKFTNFANYVFIDAPCSGSGTIRRNPGLKWKLNENSLSELSLKQLNILELYSKCLIINGTIVYATCSIFDSENEMIVEKFLEKNSNFVLCDARDSLEKYNLSQLVKNKYLKLYPHIHGTDGFFGAKLKRIK